MLLNCGAGEDSWESLDCKEIHPVHPKGNQSWIFIGRTGAEAEAPILWSLDEKNWLIGKDPDAWKDWGQEEKGTTEDEMVEWHHQLNGHKSEQVLEVGDDREAWCAAVHGVAKSHTQLNWTEPLIIFPNSNFSSCPPTSFLRLIFSRGPHTFCCKFPLTWNCSLKNYF